MSREKREKSNSKIYHVMCRALNKQTLFDEEEDYLFYLKHLKEISQKYKVIIYAYCLMTNHIHILIYDKNEMINQFMKSLNTTYAKYYNKKYGRTGYVFNDRYHSEPVENMKYLLTVIRYIHQNPVKAMICKNTYDYKFTSIHAYRRNAGNYLQIVNTKAIYKKFDKKEFLSWNEIENHDRCMDIMNNKLKDADVAELLFKTIKVKNKKEYLEKSEAEKVVAIMKLIDISIPLMQISRVSGLYYNKLQKLRLGKEGKTVSLTYKRK